jgi:hypothetical protein
MFEAPFVTEFNILAPVTSETTFPASFKIFAAPLETEFKRFVGETSETTFEAPLEAPLKMEDAPFAMEFNILVPEVSDMAAFSALLVICVTSFVTEFNVLASESSVFLLVTSEFSIACSGSEFEI